MTAPRNLNLEPVRFVGIEAQPLTAVADQKLALHHDHDHAETVTTQPNRTLAIPFSP